MPPRLGNAVMDPLGLVNLSKLMNLTRGTPEISIGLIDGPVVVSHPDLVGESIREIHGKDSGACAIASSTACMHGTFVAGILSARRGSGAPAICPDCTLLVRPIYAEATHVESLPIATSQELAAALIECIGSGAGIINLSGALAH